MSCTALNYTEKEFIINSCRFVKLKRFFFLHFIEQLFVYSDNMASLGIRVESKKQVSLLVSYFQISFTNILNVLPIQPRGWFVRYANR